MTTALERAGTVILSALAMAALLLGLVALALGRPDRMAGYLAFAAAAVVTVAVLMRREARRRREREAALPEDLRPRRRRPRRPIAFPIRESLLTFALWYVAAVGVDRAVTQTTTYFTLAAVGPFAAFILTTLTIAGRHMAFRLTAEEAAAELEPTSGPDRDGPSG